MRKSAFVAPLLLVVVAFPLIAQHHEPLERVDAARLRAILPSATSSEAAPVPASNFTVSRGIGILEDDGGSYWAGAPSAIDMPATFRATPAASNTFSVQRIPYQFDDNTAGATVVYDGATRPVLGFLDANYRRYNLPRPLAFAGQSYTSLSISLWGAVAFGNADSSQVNYDPTVVSSMFRVPMVAVWYELFYYPSTARILAKNKSGSIVVTWQNVVSRHSTTPATFQVEFFDNGQIQLSYQSLPVTHGLIGFSTGTESVTRQTSNGIAASDVPAWMQVSQASLDDYGGIIAGVTLTLNAPIPSPLPAGESYRYALVVNSVEVVGLQVSGSQSPYLVTSSTRIPNFPAAQINSWEIRQNGTTLSFRFPASSLEPYFGTGAHNWSIETSRFGGAGFVKRNVTQTLPMNFTNSSIRREYLPRNVNQTVELPAGIFHYMPGVWNTDRIRESIAAYLTSRGQNVDTFRFFPTTYDDGLQHANYAGTYPKPKTVTGIGTVPARTDCNCYGAEFSELSEALADEATTQIALTHELVHEFALYADFRDLDGQVKGTWRDAGIPCFGGAHPNHGLVNTSMFPDAASSAATISVMGGSINGTFQLSAKRYGMSEIEMYLMGLAASGEVKPMRFVQNGVTTNITIDQVIAAHGPRNPAFTGQRRTFRVPAFVVKRKSETVGDAQLQQLQSLLWRWQTRFWKESGARARVNQTLDGSCDVTLNANSRNSASSTGTATIDVLTESGCAWTAVSNASWITVTTGASGNGDGTVTYSLAANPGDTARTGTITIGGQSFTIGQAGTGKRRSVR